VREETLSARRIDEMAAVVRSFRPHGFRLMARSLAETDTTGLLPSIDAPTLLLWGDGDRRSTLEVAEAFDDAIPGAELKRIAKAGHVSNMERPEEFSALVRRFARSNQRCSSRYTVTTRPPSSRGARPSPGERKPV